MSVVSRDLDLLKSRGITSVLTTLSHGTVESSDVEISSLIDTWLLLRNHETNGERNRLMFVIKSRGTAHSNQVREFLLTDEGPELVDVYIGPEGVLTGSARLEQSARDNTDKTEREREIARRREEFSKRTDAVEEQVAALRRELAEESAEFERLLTVEEGRRDGAAEARAAAARTRSGEAADGDQP